MACELPPLVSLATVKRGMYNPQLPTIRRMAMDDENQRMSDEHCRHTTTLTREDFQKVEGWQLNCKPPQPPAPRIHCHNITETGRALEKHVEELEATKKLFHDYLESECGVKPPICDAQQKLIDDIGSDGQAHFVGNRLSCKPQPPRETRFLLKGREHRDCYGIPAPLPEDFLSRHRPRSSPWARGARLRGTRLPHTHTSIPF